MQRKHQVGFGITVVSLIFHAFLVSRLSVVLFPDTKTYLALADNILNWNWVGFHFRTPGYSLFLALIQLVFGVDPYYVGAVQLMLSGLVPVMLYSIFVTISNRITVGALCAVVYFLDWSSVAMNFAILTEGLSQFLLVVSVWLGVVLLEKPHIKYAVALALSTFALTMVRPAFLPLAPVLCGILLLAWYCSRQSIRRVLAAASIIFLLPLLFTALWCLEVKRETGYFTISHITGIALFNQVNIETIDPLLIKNDELLTELIHEAEISEEEHGSSLNVAWKVVLNNDLLPEWETAQNIKAISSKLILQHPTHYLQKALANSREFWIDKATYVYATSGTHKQIQSAPITGALYRFIDNQFWLRPGRILFLLLLTTVLTTAYICGRFSTVQKCGVVVIASSIIVCQLTHVLINGADLARYRMPVQTIYLALAVYLPLAFILKFIDWQKAPRISNKSP